MKKNIKTLRKKNKDGIIELNLICKNCGLPIDFATDMGVFCKNMCTSETNTRFYNFLKKFKLTNKK